MAQHIADITEQQVREFLAAHDGGATTAELATFLGEPPALVARTIHCALRKVRTKLQKRGLTFAQMV